MPPIHSTGRGDEEDHDDVDDDDEDVRKVEDDEEAEMNQQAQAPIPWQSGSSPSSDSRSTDEAGRWASRHGHVRDEPAYEPSRNRFFDPPGGRGDEGDGPKKGRVYAAIEVPEQDDEPNQENGPSAPDEPVLLECVDTSWFSSMQWSSNGLMWTDIYRKAPLSVLELTGYPLPPFPEGAQPGDIAWFEFGYEPAGPSSSDARIYTNLYTDGAAVRITFHEPRSMGWQGSGPMGANGWLAQAISARPDDSGSQEALRRLLRGIDSKGGVAVYDVGQGSCQAALESDLHLPALYVDFGGGVLTNRKTFPDEFAGFCFSRRPMVVLSHWDWDHWSSAYLDEDALSVPWLAPPVPTKPIQQAFAADLYVRGFLHLWDHTWPAEIREGAVRIERCTGRTSNDSGLAVTLHAGPRSRRNCLLPGDAAYAFIPSVLGGSSFNALCMTHHGGKLHSSVYPKAKRGGASALSAGLRNSYKHPLFHTVASHLEEGWKFPTGTGLSGQRPCHVLLPWGRQPHVFQGGCHADKCSVAIADMAPSCGRVHRLASRPISLRSRLPVAV